MENIEVILSIAGTALSLLVACVTFVVKLVRSVKARIKEQGLTALLDAVAPVMELAEGLTHYSGEEKKEYVLTKVNQFAIDSGVEFDAEAVSGKIEELIELTKQVNKR